MTKDNEKSEVLRLVHDTHRKEILYHRDVMNEVFKWTTGLFLAAGGGIIAIGPTRWALLGVSAKLFVTIAVLIISFFALRLNQHSADAIDANARLVVKTDKMLHFFEPDYFSREGSLYPQKWQQWGDKKSAGYYHIYNTVIMLVLGLAVVIFAWAI